MHTRVPWHEPCTPWSDWVQSREKEVIDMRTTDTMNTACKDIRYRKTDTLQPAPALQTLQRSSRIVKNDDAWYFRTREGVSAGPFQSQFDAELGASLLVARLAQLEDGIDARSEIARFIDTCDFIQPVSPPKQSIVHESNNVASPLFSTWFKKIGANVLPFSKHLRVGA